MIARRLEIRGRVQGVFYRESMVRAANEEGCVGWVRNRDDGTVEAWVQGSLAAVERMVTWSRAGPPSAHVASVDVHEVEPDAALRTFTRRAVP